MPFPASDRVIYTRNPLTEVVCQLRFPPILTIETELPARFQEAIRDRFPLLTEAQPALPQGFPANLAKLLPAGIRTQRVYEFSSEEPRWKLTLSKDWIALSCTRYEHWESFREMLRPALDALLRQYRPSFFTRIGLRYVNLIQRSVVGLKDVNWSDLIRGYIAPEMSTPIAGELVDTDHTLIVRLDDKGGKVRVYHGLAQHESGEQVYLIDNDFSTEQKTEVADATNKLDHFHQQSGNLFRWCIADRLHNAMEPNAVVPQQAR